MYSGEIKNGIKEGFGVIMYGSNDSYTGNWKDGMMNDNEGVYTC